MLEAKENTEATKFEPRIVAFYCGLGAGADAILHTNFPANINIIKVPCSYRVNPLLVLGAFRKGADGVLLCGCRLEDCRHTGNSYYTRRRMNLFLSMLEYLGIGARRFRIELVSANNGKCFTEIMDAFVEQIAALGENVVSCDLRCEK